VWLITTPPRPANPIVKTNARFPIAMAGLS
jgi:hypothetical protein